MKGAWFLMRCLSFPLESWSVDLVSYSYLMGVGFLMGGQGKDRTPDERRVAICVFDDVAEQCGDAAIK